MCIKVLHITIEPRHDYVQSITAFARVAQILILRYHISSQNFQEFAKASFRLLGCVYTVIPVGLVER